jgi:hypothetical protein
MHLASRALVRVKAVLFGPPPESGRTAREPDTAPAAAPGLPVNRPSPEMWAAFLASARRRRARCPWPRTELPPIAADDITSTLVGAYLILPEARQRARQAARFAEVS